MVMIREVLAQGAARKWGTRRGILRLFPGSRPAHLMPLLGNSRIVSMPRVVTQSVVNLMVRSFDTGFWDLLSGRASEQQQQTDRHTKR